MASTPHPASATASTQSLVTVDSPSQHERSESTTLTTEGEPPSPPASKAVRARYLKFIAAYVKDPSSVGRAYRTISPRCAWTTAQQNGAALLKDGWVAAQIEARLQKILAASDVSMQDIVVGLKQIANFDVRRLYIKDRETGEWRERDPWELDDRTAMAIDQLSIERTALGGRKIKWKGAGKLGALDLLARYKGMLKEPERPPIVANIQINF